MPFSLVRCVFAFASDVFDGYKSFFAFASDVSARKTRFRLCEQRFRWVNAFSPLLATFSLGMHVFAFAIDVCALLRLYAFGIDVFGG